MGNRRRTDEIRALQVHVDDAVEVLLCRCRRVSLVPHSSGIYDCIEPPEGFDRLLHCRTTLIDSSNVARCIDDSASMGVLHVDTGRSPATIDESLQRGVADAPGTSSNQCDGCAVFGHVLSGG